MKKCLKEAVNASFFVLRNQKKFPERNAKESRFFHKKSLQSMFIRNIIIKVLFT